MFNPNITIKTKEFIKLLKENVEHPFMSVKMIIKPSIGWDYKLSAYIHNIVGEPDDDYTIMYISNAFSDQERRMNTNDIIEQLTLLDKDKDDDKSCVSFEIYGTQKENEYEYINNQIVSAYPSVENISVKETDDFVAINIFVDRI